MNLYIRLPRSIFCHTQSTTRLLIFSSKFLNIMSFHPKICLYASLKNRAFSSHDHSIIHYHANKIINDSLISANSQSVFRVSQLSQKCLFGVLVQIKTQTKPTHCI